MSHKINIEIWSDIVCPFCYLGYRKLEHAFQATGLAGFFEISWHSYQLDPDFPVDSTESTTAYLTQRKGMSTGQIRQIYTHLTEQGQKYGIDFQFDKALSFNTYNAHRLLQWSKIHNKSTALELAFFNAYFTDGADLSKPENLLAVCDSVGLSLKDINEAFSNPQFEAQIEEDKYNASQTGIRGVPYFLIGERFPVAGAQPDEAFEEALRNAYAQAQQ